MTYGQVFDEIYRSNQWGDADSRSGEGSNLIESKAVRAALPSLITNYEIRSMLDIPCGDFYWMKHVDLSKVDYLGCDIVERIIAQNKKFATTSCQFRVADLVVDQLPQVDLIFSRDCLVHLPFKEIRLAIENIARSSSKWLLTTTFVDRKENVDIAVGQWRPLNLQAPPFSFPEPQLLINEVHPKSAWCDKSLGLWEISKLPVGI